MGYLHAYKVYNTSTYSTDAGEPVSPELMNEFNDETLKYTEQQSSERDSCRRLTVSCVLQKLKMLK